MTAAGLEARSPGADPQSLLRVSSNALLRRRWALPAAYVAGALALFAMYLRQARTVPTQSDGASNALQAWDMMHGNVLLHGWSLSDVSFYTTELPQYMLVELVRGLNSDVVHVAAAMTYTLLVVLAALLAKGRATGREAAVRQVVAAGIMLAPSLGPGSLALLANPDHTGTQVPLLAIWLILDRARARWWVPVVVAVLLAWVQVADALVLYEGVLPLLLVCAVRVHRRRGPLREQWYEVALAVAAIASAGAAALVMKLIEWAGGFTLWTQPTIFGYVASMSSHIWVSVESVLLLYGADFSGKQLGASAVVALVHLAGVALAGWAWVRAMRRFSGQDLVVQVLAVALAVLLIAYTLRGYNLVDGGAHEVVGVLPIGAVLAGRLLASRLSPGHHSPGHHSPGHHSPGHPSSGHPSSGQFSRDGLLPVLAVVLACYGAVLAHNAVQPPASSTNQQVASWLQARHLTYGLSDYWTANSVTVASGNRIQVRPVDRAEQQLVLRSWESEGSWYDHRVHDATFMIVPRLSGCSYAARAREKWQADARAAFGPPAGRFRVAGFLILVWHRNLLNGGLIRQLPGRPPNC